MKGLKLHKRNLRTLLAGIGLIVLTNTIVLAGVAYNRGGTPEASVTLTERELGLPYYYRASKENSGMSLRIQARGKGNVGTPYYYSNYQEAYWFTKEKLAELGFDVAEPIDETKQWSDYKREKEKEVILVLEYDGEAYQAALKAAQENLDEQIAKAQSKDKPEQCDCEQARRELEHEQKAASRLFIIDAGLDRETLRQQYPDNGKYLLLKGVMGVYIDRNPNRTRTYSGYIKSLSIPNINIPLEYHHVLEPAMEAGYQGGKNLPPRYVVKLNIGKRLEPWVVGVKEYHD